MSKYKTKVMTPSDDTVVFRPDSRDASKDYHIPRKIAEALFQAGEIHGDGTNGGYMPNPNSGYNVRQHRVKPK